MHDAFAQKGKVSRSKIFEYISVGTPWDAVMFDRVGRRLWYITQSCRAFRFYFALFEQKLQTYIF